MAPRTMNSIGLPEAGWSVAVTLAASVYFFRFMQEWRALPPTDPAKGESLRSVMCRAFDASHGHVAGWWAQRAFRLGSMILDLDQNRADVTLIDDTGAVRDYFTVIKDPCLEVPDVDEDGVCDADDVCDGTMVPEPVPLEGLGINRWALVDGDDVFDTNPPNGVGPKVSFTLEDTAGCSCEQAEIAIDALVADDVAQGRRSADFDAVAGITNSAQRFDPVQVDHRLRMFGTVLEPPVGVLAAPQ